MTEQLRWTAAKDGIGHAAPGRVPRALCGVTQTPDRFAWPEKRRCIACEVIGARDHGYVARRGVAPRGT